MEERPENRFDSLRGRIVGQVVTYRRLACDSLLLYLGCEPGDCRGLTIWFQPIWHCLGPHGVLLGSMQVAEVCESEEKMDSLSACMDVLHGRVVEWIATEPLTFDLTVSVDGGFSVRTFVADATTDESWHIRDNATGLRLRGSPHGHFDGPNGGDAGSRR
jgi:hypothetical protein